MPLLWTHQNNTARAWIEQSCTQDRNVLSQQDIQMDYLIWKVFLWWNLSWPISCIWLLAILSWSEYQSLQHQAAQMLPFMSCLWASLLDSLHLLPSCPQSSLVLLSGERHVPSRKANYLPLPHFHMPAHVQAICTQAPASELCGGWDAEQKNNHSDLTWVSEGMSGCVFSSPKIIPISILCYMRSWSGQA